MEVEPKEIRAVNPPRWVRTLGGTYYTYLPKQVVRIARISQKSQYV